MNVQVQKPSLLVQEVPWYEYHKSTHYNFIRCSGVEVCKRIYEKSEEKEIEYQLSMQSVCEEGYFFIAMYNNEPVGIASAYTSEDLTSKDKILNEQFLHIPEHINTTLSRSVLNVLFKALEQKAIDLDVHSLCISCSNKTSMEKYIRILLKKGFNIETITCRKRIYNGKCN